MWPSRVISAKKREVPSWSESWICIDAPTLNGESRSRFARTGAPALRQYRVEAHGAQQCTLAGHIRAADDQDPQVAPDLHIVRDRNILGEQRVTQLLAVENGQFRGEFGEHVVGVLIAITGKRRECFHLAHRVQPTPQGRPRSATPILERIGEMQVPQQEGPDPGDKLVVARIDKVG